MPEPVRIELSRDEALVLFELVSRFEKSENLAVAHHAEAVALWSLLALLERALPEPFCRDYPKLLEAAQQRIAEVQEGG